MNKYNKMSNELCVKLADAIVVNFNTLLLNAGYSDKYDFEKISQLFDRFIVLQRELQDPVDVTYLRPSK